jgi:hypothetical protein
LDKLSENFFGPKNSVKNRNFHKKSKFSHFRWVRTCPKIVGF